MSQEFVWPLALSFSLDVPGNRYYQEPALADWVVAGVRFAAKSGHPTVPVTIIFPSRGQVEPHFF